MKKSLFALAALGAFATAAQAQSSVTLYGTIDASVQAIQNGGADPTVAVTTALNNGVAKSTATPSTASATPSLVDGAISTSVWGMKGVEDLGGGMKAVFEAQGDLQPNNGGTNANGLFRRAANVGLGGSFGTVYLGLKSNPLADASSASFAVGGNTVHQVRNVVGYSSTDFIKNGIQYESPMFSGLQARLAYGMSNTFGETSNGTIMAASLVYSTGGLRLTGAYNKQTAAVDGAIVTSSANYSSTYFASAANSKAFDQSGYILGAKYNFAGLGLPALTLSYGFAHSDITNYSVTYGANPVSATTSSTAGANANMVSLGYQATPSLLLGANYIITTADSSLYNLQARYSLSKRTTAYFQASMAKNGAGADSSGGAFGNFMPVNTNSGTSPAVNVGGYGYATAYSGGLPNTSSSAYGVGLIHSF